MKKPHYIRFTGIAAAFAAGALLTMFLMRPSPEVHDAHDEHGHEAEHEEAAIALSPEAIQTAGIRTETVGYALSGQTISVPGTVEPHPSHVAKITPPAAGRIVSIKANVGDKVARGQTLAVLQSPEVAQAHAAVHDAAAEAEEASAAVRTAGAGLRAARAREANARIAASRQKELAQTGAFSQPSLLAARSELADAQSELLKAQTELQSHSQVLERSRKLYAAELISRAELEQAELEQRQDSANVDIARARVATAKQALEREERVSAGGMLNKQALQGSEGDLRSARADVQQAQAAVAAAEAGSRGARARLAAANDNLHALEGSGHAGGSGRIALQAPLGGTITARHATLGEAVERSSELFEIESHRTVLVLASVPENQVSSVRPGSKVTVTVTAYPGRKFGGLVQATTGKLDERSRSLPVRCIVENPDGALKPEMFARVSLATSARKPALTIPESALVSMDGKQYVFVREGNSFERRQVETGPAPEGRLEVKGGLKQGGLVVTSGALVLKSEMVRDELKGHDH